MAGVFFTISVGTVSGKLRPGMHVVPGLFPPIRSVRCLKGPQRAPAACIRLRGAQKNTPGDSLPESPGAEPGWGDDPQLSTKNCSYHRIKVYILQIFFILWAAPSRWSSRSFRIALRSKKRAAMSPVNAVLTIL